MEEICVKEDLDDIIQFDIDKVVCIRFGSASDVQTIHLDEIINKTSVSLSKMASFYSVDPQNMPEYVKYFGITIMPAIVFFFNAEHMKVDFGNPDHSKWIGVFAMKQDLIDLVETIYRGAMRGHHIVTCPIPAARIPKYELLYSEQ
jgi:hypothetical protein